MSARRLLCAAVLALAIAPAALIADAASPPAAADARPPPAATRAYTVCVTNEAGGSLTIVDGATHAVVATVPLGQRPRGIRRSPRGDRLYVALSGSPIAGPGPGAPKLPPPDRKADGIGVFDLEGQRLDRVLSGVSDPKQLAIGADGRRLYVASEDTGTLVVLDAQSGSTLRTLEVGAEAGGTALSPDGARVFVTSAATDRVAVVDTATSKVLARVPVGKRPRYTAFSPDGALAYVIADDATITVLDVRTLATRATFRMLGANVRPVGIEVSPDGRQLYVAGGGAGVVLVLAADTGRELARVRVGARPWNLALSPDGALLYVANGPSNDLSVIDTRSLQVLRTIRVGERPWGVVVVPLR